MTAPKQERGVALVIVLWVGLLVVAIAGAFIVDTRNSTRLTRNFMDNAEARALADGGIHLAIYELVHPDIEKQWRRDGRLYRRAVPGGELEIAIEDEAGKIDLNYASADLLEGLFRSAGIDGDRAIAFVQAIDEIRRENANSSIGRPVNQAFFSVDSLGQVPGMTADLHALLRPALTVFSSGKLDYLFSPREALLAIPGITVEAVDTFLLVRARDEVDNPLGEFLVVGRARDFFQKGKSTFVTVKVLAKSKNGAKFVRSAIVNLANRDNQPFIVEWREDDTLPTPSAESSVLPGGAT